MRRSGFFLVIMFVLGAVIVACRLETPEPQVVEKIVVVEKEVPVEVIREVETTTGGWEVWLSDQSDSADIGTDNPSGAMAVGSSFMKAATFSPLLLAGMPKTTRNTGRP